MLVEIFPLVAAVYSHHRGGCCWNLLFTEGKVSDSYMGTCAGLALVLEHADCVALTDPILAMIPAQRKKLCRQVHDIHGEI